MDSTQNILNLFEQISAIPRGTGREAQLRGWLCTWAERHQLSWKVDEAGNLVIRVPATPGFEQAPIIVLQGHMDMVCEKTPDSPHDFTRDPIGCIVEGEWLRADRTTLGADNGIAIALAMALVEDKSVGHPPLELLFTVEEEVGIGGANKLQPGFIAGKVLLNLDSEEEGTFIVGCAGGQTTRIFLPLKFEALPSRQAYRLEVSGLQGGHSGVDIHKHRANANKLLGRALAQLQKMGTLRLISIKGGTAHNAIARGAEAVITFDPTQQERVEQGLQRFQAILRDEYAVSDPGVTLTLAPAPAEQAVTAADTERAIQLLTALPHGVAEMSASVPGFVETSNNLATVQIAEGALQVVTSQRSTVMSRLQELTERISAIGALAGAEVTNGEAYSGWQPNRDSQLVRRSVEIYTQTFGKTPNVEMIHAGLECGVIGGIFGGMDMISLGATIQNPHSPSERLHIPSVKRVWQYLVAFMESHRS
ncbi:MAG: aminoacyl-histidine dipeptidase [Anaerolineales bacterium]